jgi:hypothetical protein
MTSSVLIFYLWFLSFVLPDGVIGNTWAFGAHIPGSSPGRVVDACRKVGIKKDANVGFGSKRRLERQCRNRSSAGN